MGRILSDDCGDPRPQNSELAQRLPLPSTLGCLGKDVRLTRQEKGQKPECLALREGISGKRRKESQVLVKVRILSKDLGSSFPSELN